MSAQAYPLSWPDHTQRTPSHKRRPAKFGKHSIAKAVKEIKRNVTLLGGKYLVISSNLRLKNDGDPYSVQPRIDDPGVTLWFQLAKTSICLPCDRWNIVEHNLWALAKHIEAMRGMDRWGVGTVEQQFAGFKALPAKVQDPDWWDVLGVNKFATDEAIKAAYRTLAMMHHPDRGGNRDRYDQIQRAYELAIPKPVQEPIHG